MTRGPASNADAVLSEAAYTLAEEYRAGLLARLECPEWDSTWRNLCAELERRAPGYVAEAYSVALDRGFVETR